MSTPSFTFNLQDFEGPIDLLLHLVESKELDVYKVAIDQVLTQYQLFLSTIETHDLDLSAEFLSVVSSLMLLKSKMLLPEEPEEKEPIDETALRSDILEQLVHYYKFRDIAHKLQERENLQSQKFYRGVDAELLPIEKKPELKPCPHTLLSELFLKVLEKKKLAGFNLIHEENYKISDKIKELRQLLNQSSSLEFTHVFCMKKPKAELIALFIALLEMLKQGFAKLQAQEHQWTIEKGDYITQ